jgi:hypothetical protein
MERSAISMEMSAIVSKSAVVAKKITLEETLYLESNILNRLIKPNLIIIIEFGFFILHMNF